MRRTLGHVAAWWFFAAGVLGGCSVELGAEQIDALELDRTYELGAAPLGQCPFGSKALTTDDARAAAVDFAPVRDGCLISIRLEEAIVLDAAQIASRAERLQGRGDIDSIQGLDVVIEELELADGAGDTFDFAAVADLVIQVEGHTILRERDLALMRQRGQTRVTLPQAFVDRFVSALYERTSLRTSLVLRLLVRDPERSVPSRLHLRTVLQPVLIVDGVAAKL